MIMKRLGIGPALVGSLWMVGCGSTSGGQKAAAGCYELSYGPEVAGFPRDPFGWAMPSRRLRLLPGEAGSPPGGTVAAIDEDAGSVPPMASSWAPLGTDSILVTWQQALAVTSLRLAVGRTELVGAAEYQSDLELPRREAREVRATRIECPPDP